MTWSKHQAADHGQGLCHKCFETVNKLIVGPDLKLAHWDGKRWNEHVCKPREA
jgi:hypothetical protein